MEPAAAWVPCEFQQVNWTLEDEQANGEVWAPPAGIPVECTSTDMFAGIWSLQPYVPSSSSSGGQQQLVQYNYYAAATEHHGPIIENAAAAQELLPHHIDTEIFFNNNPMLVLQEAECKFEDDSSLLETKIHRYPLSIKELGEWYTVPRIVAIGPYHHGQQQLKDAENVKLVAARHCINISGISFEDMRCAVVTVLVEIDARRLYNNDVMEGINDCKLVHMMLFDACFLVTYMLKLSATRFEGVAALRLFDFFESNVNDIAHDIMLLENQIPWPVVDAIWKYMSVRLEKFIAGWGKDHGRLHDRVYKDPTVDLDNSYKPPHLLGLLRFHLVGESSSRRRTKMPKNMESIPISVSAIELAKMGINLTVNKTTALGDLDLIEKPIFFAELSMAPLSLNDLRASLLVNMAAYELCTTPDFFDEDVGHESSAVCSYLLLCMLMHREEDVHQLRTKGILQGGAGLSNKKTLDFFTSLQNLREGCYYAHVMVWIQIYRINKSMRIEVYAFLYSNIKTILTVLSVIGLFASILGVIKSLKRAH
ncbi:unnamed protein product [Urochloa humidicola]